jgi:hypothetical protein
MNPLNYSNNKSKYQDDSKLVKLEQNRRNIIIDYKKIIKYNVLVIIGIGAFVFLNIALIHDYSSQMFTAGAVLIYFFMFAYYKYRDLIYLRNALYELNEEDIKEEMKKTGRDV